MIYDFGLSHNSLPIGRLSGGQNIPLPRVYASDLV